MVFFPLFLQVIILSAHILIVDDDATIRATLRKIFENEGFRTSQAISGVEALQLIRHQPFDLVTMDMAMAHLDGVDTIAILRNERDLPILVISAHLTEEIKKDIEAQGITFCLAKPFSPHEVIAMARRAMKSRPSG